MWHLNKHSNLQALNTLTETPLYSPRRQGWPAAPAPAGSSTGRCPSQENAPEAMERPTYSQGILALKRNYPRKAAYAYALHLDPRDARAKVQHPSCIPVSFAFCISTTMLAAILIHGCFSPSAQMSNLHINLSTCSG